MRDESVRLAATREADTGAAKTERGERGGFGVTCPPFNATGAWFVKPEDPQVAAY